MSEGTLGPINVRGTPGPLNVEGTPAPLMSGGPGLLNFRGDTRPPQCPIISLALRRVMNLLINTRILESGSIYPLSAVLNKPTYFNFLTTHSQLLFLLINKLRRINFRINFNNFLC